MELRQLEYFVAAVDRGTFTRAAAAQHVSQPALSEGISRLEAELGVELFHRVGRRVVLAPAGQALVEPARAVLHSTRLARAAVASVAAAVTGELVVAAIPTLAVDPLAALVGRLRARHQNIRVRIVEAEDAAGPARLVRAGAAEMGVTALPAPPDLVTVPLGVQEIVAVGPPGWDPPAPLSLARLATMPLIVTPEQTSTRSLLDAAMAAAGLSVAPAVEVAQREAIAPLVVAGAGIGVLPASLATTAERAGAVTVALRPAITRRVGLVHRRDRLSPPAAAFRELAAS